jgi:hypothetical protein
MKVGTLTFEQAIEKLYSTHAIMCDQLGELVSVCQEDDILEVYPQSATGCSRFEFVKSQNETVQVYSTIGANISYQYMKMYTEDGDEMDFVLFQPTPIITLDSLAHPVK